MRNCVYYTAQIIQVTCMVFVGLLGALVNATPTEWGSIEKHIQLFQEHAWWLFLFISFLLVLSKVVVNWVGPPWVWNALRRTLDRFRQHAFSNIDGDPTHYHRVTLFRRKSCWWLRPWRHKYWPWGKGRWPFSGWMVPVARSGQATQVTRTVFLAPDDADSSEGIAGEVWQRNQVIVQQLPSLTGKSTETEISKYAEAARMPYWWIKHRLLVAKPCPQMLCGIPVEVNNRFWGVLVLDSRRQDTIDYQSQAWPAFERVFPLAIEELLKRI